ncbi:MAG TPA: hypothetical protein VMT64_15580, partial [Candidatus Binataceae bacterium]|nr:hypothetical protein [Candidatus Binataceae bacterium]
MIVRFGSLSLKPSTQFVLVALILLMTAVGASNASAKTPAKIVVIGTDEQVYVCNGDCAKPECLTCPVKGLQVRVPSPLRRVAMRTQFEVPGMPPLQDEPRPQLNIKRYGWPTFSPDGTKLAYAWAGH